MHDRASVFGLAAIFLVSVIVYSLVGSKHELSDLFPDEVIYAKLSQSFAGGSGLSWRGTDWGMPPLWPVVLSVVWHLGSAPDGYASGKVLGSVLASTTVFPVWLLAREFVGPRLALVPAALTVAGAWMQVTSFLMSDVLAFPLATASLAATVMAVKRPGSRWILASLGFSIPAILCRTQLLVLPVILVVALIFDVLRQPRGERRRRLDGRPLALWIGLTVAVVGGLLALAIDPGLTRYALLSSDVSVGGVLEATGKQAAATIVLFAVVPVVAAVALMVRTENWRDETTGPVLVTLSASVLVLLPVLGRFEAYGTSGPVDRYVMYLAPLLFLALVLAPGRIGRGTTLAVGVVVAVAMVASPKYLNYLEQPGLYGAEKRLASLGQFFAEHPGLALAIVGIPITVAGALALTHRSRWGLAVASALIALIMVGQSYTSQHHEISLIREFRSTVAPTQLDWVDAHTKARVAELAIGKRPRLSASPDLYTDFFNKNVDGLYSTVKGGANECHLRLAEGGDLVKGRACAPWPRLFVLQEAPFRATLYGQRVLASTPDHGTLIRTSAEAPRLLALVKAPCTETGCTGSLQMGLYLDAPADVAVTFSPAGASWEASLDGKAVPLAAGRPNTIRFRAQAGDRGYVIPVNWRVQEGAPELTSVELRSGGRRTRIW